MKSIEVSFEFKYYIHPDAWTETLAGVLYGIKIIEELENKGDRVNKMYLTRMSIISSSYLAEQVFVKTVDSFLQDMPRSLSLPPFCLRLLDKWKLNNTIKNCGISRALDEWPEILTGTRLSFDSEPLQSLKALIKKRNDLVHTILDNCNYVKATEIATSALFTALEASKAIESHFFPIREFSYQGWLNCNEIPKGTLFQKLKI